MMFKLYVNENGIMIPIRRVKEFDSFYAACTEAEKHVDDALPDNTVHVLADFGYAGLSGDGGTYFKDSDTNKA